MAETFENIDAPEAIELASGSAVLVDVRETWEWNAGHAPQAISLPMSQLEDRYTELDQDATLLVICHSGQRSLSVTDALTRAGYTAINVVGGMMAWQAAGGDVVVESSDSPNV